MLRYLPLFTLGLWLAVPATPVGAESDAASIAVPAGDLNLATEAGAATLQRRIGAAASRLCADAETALPLSRGSVSRCRYEAIARAQPEVQALLAAARSPAARTQMLLASR